MERLGRLASEWGLVAELDANLQWHILQNGIEVPDHDPIARVFAERTAELREEYSVALGTLDGFILASLAKRFGLAITRYRTNHEQPLPDEVRY